MLSTIDGSKKNRGLSTAASLLIVNATYFIRDKLQLDLERMIDRGRCRLLSGNTDSRQRCGLLLHNE